MEIPPSAQIAEDWIEALKINSGTIGGPPMTTYSKLPLTTSRREILKYAGAAGIASVVGVPGLGTRTALAQGGDFDEFFVAMWSGMPNLDPEQNTIRTCLIAQNWLFDPLIWRNNDSNELEPYLAEEYSFVGNNTWRFRIRQGVRFHNGEKLDAHAVKFSMDRRLSEDVGSPNAKSFSYIIETKVVDEYTVDFVCSSPFPMLPAYMPTFSIMAPQYYSENSMQHLALNPVGSGPFRLVEFKPDDILRVERNDDYWGQTPAIKRVTAPIVEEDATRVASLLAGDLHISPRPVMEDFDRINATEGTMVSTSIGNRIVVAGLNYDLEPMNDKRVRQALNYAVDTATLNDVYLRGTGELLAGLLPSTVVGHDPALEPYPYDPEMAKSLLRDAGYPDGFETTIEVNPGWLIAGTEVTQALQNFLKQVGIEAALQIRDAGTLSSRITSRKAGPIYMLSWGGNSTFDADSYLEVLLDEGAWSCNTMPEVRELVQAGRATADQAEREEIYKQASQIVREEAPYLFMYLQPNTYGIATNHNWRARPDEMIPLWHVNRV